MGLSIILILIAFFLFVIICTYIYKNRNQITEKRIVKIITLITLIVLLIVIALFYTKKIKSTELGNISIYGYFINEEIDEKTIRDQYEKTHENRNSIIYTVMDTNLLRLALSKSNTIMTIYVYNDNNFDDPLMLTTPDGELVIGKSSFDEVVNVFGDNYSTYMFSDSVEKVIIYHDNNAKIRLKCNFNDDLLVSAILGSF